MRVSGHVYAGQWVITKLCPVKAFLESRSNFKFSTLHHKTLINFTHPLSSLSLSSQTYPTNPMVHYQNQKKSSLNPSQFYNVLYQKLITVQNQRQAHKKQAANIAREAGKKYEEIMVNKISGSNQRKLSLIFSIVTGMVWRSRSVQICEIRWRAFKGPDAVAHS